MQHQRFRAHGQGGRQVFLGGRPFIRFLSPLLTGLLLYGGTFICTPVAQAASVPLSASFLSHKSYVQDLVRDKRTAQAVRFLKKLEQKHPLRARMLRGYLLMLQGKQKQARVLWRPMHAEPGLRYQELEYLYEELNLPNEAVDLLRSRLQRRPDRTLYWKLIKYLALVNRKSELYDTLLQALQFQPRDLTQVNRTLVKEIEDYKDLELAHARLSAFEKGLASTSPLAATVARMHINLLLHFDRPRLARQRALLFAQRWPGQEAYLFSLLKALYDLQEKDTARALLQRIPLKARSDRIRFLQAALQQERAPGEAARIYSDLLRRGYPNRDDVVRGLAICHEAQSNYSKALQTIRRVRNQQDGDRERAGRYCLLLGKPEEALNQFTFLPQPDQGLFFSLAYLAQDKSNEAVKALRQALRASHFKPRINESLELLFLLQHLGKDKKKLRIFTAFLLALWKERYQAAAGDILRLQAGADAFWKDRLRIAAARLLEKGGKAARALTVLDKVLKDRGPLTDRALYWKGFLLKHRLGKTKAGDAVFFDLVAKYPHSVYLFKARQEIAAD